MFCCTAKKLYLAMSGSPIKMQLAVVYGKAHAQTTEVAFTTKGFYYNAVTFKDILSSYLIGTYSE